MEEQTKAMQREQTITQIADHISNGALAAKFVCDALHDLALDNHDGVWTTVVVSGVDLLRAIVGVIQFQNAELWQYGNRDVPF